MSVDNKKGKVVGEYMNTGSARRPEGSREDVDVPDFVDKELGRAIP
ncbi:MAG: ISAzo13-like element transposase-related protein [Beijerinckiaceae bacterium]